MLNLQNAFGCQEMLGGLQTLASGSSDPLEHADLTCLEAKVARWSMLTASVTAYMGVGLNDCCRPRHAF